MGFSTAYIKCSYSHMIYTSNSWNEALNPDPRGSTAAIPSSYFPSRNRTPSQQKWCKTKSNKHHRVPVRSNFTTKQRQVNILFGGKPSQHSSNSINASLMAPMSTNLGIGWRSPSLKNSKFRVFYSHQLSANCNNSSTWIKPNPGAPLQTQLMDIVCIHTHVYV